MPEITSENAPTPSSAGGSKSALSSRFESRIRQTTTASVLLLAATAAVVSFRHMHEPALKHGEDEIAAALVPLPVDGTIVVASMSLLLASRAGRRGGALPWIMLVIRRPPDRRLAELRPHRRAYEILMSQVRMLTQRGSDTDAGKHCHQRTPPSRAEPARTLQLTAWQWAQANRDQQGRIPSGLAIAQNFGRSPRWGRLVKRAGSS
ncbi:DUF2637 domain-containing protein [Nonomuraea rhodomycinica]|uniref:DUF2637 domain-containing protein n=1 Tax=Nonomuraea rhodomycinica TaxID=1712872 RepID=UPI0024842F77|nr:DUF2637 domain-containing protein [Nonomuraea rhodomycinica]